VSWETAQAFPPQPEAPSLARRFIAEALSGRLPGGAHSHRVLIADAQLVITELITNAINARTSQVHVVLHINGRMLRLAVRDDASGGPLPHAAGVSDEHGRGLSIISALGEAWGVEYRDREKQVWVELQIHDGH
jgi:signal transduction histidine kinase